MFRPRRIEHLPIDTDTDGVKLYTITPGNEAVSASVYLPRLELMKQARPVSWSDMPAFAIFHDGASARYLTLGWWGNDNEMFIAVATQAALGWVEDLGRYSFCLWDMEVMWHERQAFVKHMYGMRADLAAYRGDFLAQAWPPEAPETIGQ
ncbi:hypothetical protein [Dyella sp. EPa41]|uniref:hypothetical protein n=1 Tax=Dyella sp. EPa41 TaxID=1561194 RepID=UPI001914FEA2|nr:hypothetical protein [Dyella sp. EPa41]